MAEELAAACPRKEIGERRSDFGKRAFDIVFAILVGVTAVPLAVVAICLIRFMDRQEIFYRHRRVGKDGRQFDCLKFRTMRAVPEGWFEAYLADHPAAHAEWNATRKLVDDPRVTRLGRLLRKTSIDELPQLLNVLRGEMSIVGPRPLTQEEYETCLRFPKLYGSVRPGLTGLWQVSGRSRVAFPEREDLEIKYIRTRNAWLDLSIIFLTPLAVLNIGSSAA